MRIIKEKTLTEYIESVGTDANVRASSLVNLLEEFDPFLYQRPKGKPGRPVKYPFRNMSVDDVSVMLFDENGDALRLARSAAHTVASLHDYTFHVKTRENDDGKWELTVKRVG